MEKRKVTPLRGEEASKRIESGERDLERTKKGPLKTCLGRALGKLRERKQFCAGENKILSSTANTTKRPG